MTLFLRLGDNYLRAEGDAAFEEWAAQEWRQLQRKAVERWIKQTQEEVKRARAWLRKGGKK